MLSEDYLLQSKTVKKRDSKFYINTKQPQIKIKITKDEIHDFVFEKVFKERKKNLIIFGIALLLSGFTNFIFYNNKFSIFDQFKSPELPNN